MYDVVGSLASSEVFEPFNVGKIPARAFEFDHVMSLHKLHTYTN